MSNEEDEMQRSFEGDDCLLEMPNDDEEEMQTLFEGDKDCPKEVRNEQTP